jgi:acetyl-CoA synthetase
MENFNLGYLCTLRQCELGLGDKTAMRWIGARQEAVDYSFLELDRLSNRFANALGNLEIQSGEVVFTFLPKCPEQFFTFLGSLKKECITGTLFSNFGNEALLDRLGDSKAAVVITTKAHYFKLKGILPELPALRYVLLIDSGEHLSDTILSFSRLMEEAADAFRRAGNPPLIHRPYSIIRPGSTGKPKGVLHCHRSVLHQSFTCSHVFGLKEDDLFWCTADQGWVTGTSYGIIGPWSLGVTQLHYGGGFNPKEWMELLERERVTVWYTAPTALRMLLREDDALYTCRSLPALRGIFSVGEPLNPEVIAWGKRVLQKDIYDTWFQTETGAIMVSNRPGLEIRPGSMGKAVDGITIGMLDPDGAEVPPGLRGICVSKQAGLRCSSLI